MISAAEFWWNNLTPEQQEFIRNWHKKWMFPFSIEWAYNDGETNWYNFPNWPETPMRKV